MKISKQRNIFALSLLAILLLYSLHLSVNRIFQVDEIQNIFMARIIGEGTTNAYYVNPELFLIGPLSWLAQNATSTADLLVSVRIIFLVIFWLNIVLIAKCAGANLKTPQGLLILLAASTLAPFWDYGFEIRHENIILTGMLGIFLIFRSKILTFFKLLIIGSIAATTFFITFKSVVYTAPIIFIFLYATTPKEPGAYLKKIAPIALGGIITSLIIIGIYINIGLLETFFQRVVEIQLSTVGSDSKRFPPWQMLWRATTQAPLVFALILTLTGVKLSTITNKRNEFGLTQFQPEFSIFIFFLFAQFINPTPYPYNVINLIPFAFIAALTYIRQLDLDGLVKEKLFFPAVSILFICHLIPFIESTLRHANFTNWRQTYLAEVAEALTDAKTDRVFDATGLVVTRKSIGYWWFLHSLTVDKIYGKETNAIAKQLKEDPPAVIIRNYRYSWLSKPDRSFIEENYFAIADDFLVLGGLVTNQTAPYVVKKAGKYQLFEVQQNGQLTPTNSVSIDGGVLKNSVFYLSAGPHLFASGSGKPIQLLWIGNKITALPKIPNSPRQNLFFNWY